MNVPHPEDARWHVIVLPILNSRRGVLQIWLEPWGDVVEVPTGARYVLEARGSFEGARLEDRLTLEFEDDHLKVWVERAVDDLRIFDEHGLLSWANGMSTSERPSALIG